MDGKRRVVHDKMAGDQVFTHNTFWLQQVSVCNSTREPFFFGNYFSGGRREMSFVKVPIRCALSHLYPIDSMTLGRSVERLEQFQRCTPPTMKKKGERTRGGTQPKGKEKMFSHEEPLTIA